MTLATRGFLGAPTNTQSTLAARLRRAQTYGRGGYGDSGPTVDAWSTQGRAGAADRADERDASDELRVGPRMEAVEN